MTIHEPQRPRFTAPPHLIRLLAAVAPRPMTPVGAPTAEQWETQLQLITDQIWAEGWHKGAAYALALKPAAMLMVSPEERDRLASSIMDGPNDERIQS